jgi:alkylation response protein AidB-like acyl-CoA dehydrogenase
VDFQPTDDQAMLADSVERFGRDEFPLAERPRLLADYGQGGDGGRWPAMAALGWLALPLSEAQGGLGGTPSDIMTLCEGLGRHLLPEPLVSICVAAAALIGSERSELLDGIAEGSAKVALALSDDDARFDHLHIATTATRADGGWHLSGVKHFVPDGADADWFVVPARLGGQVGDIAGIGLFLVARDTSGLAIERFRGSDHHRHARLRLERATVPGDALLTDVGALPLDRAVHRAILAHCAEMVGAMDALSAITLDYIKTRQQFGVAIGSFQALQHRMVDIAIACEEARSITYRATLEAEAGVEDHGRMVSAAKARVGQCGLYVGRQAIQLHGGVGVTEELVVGHYYKRLMMLDLAYGNADHHRARYAAMAPGIAA